MLLILSDRIITQESRAQIYFVPVLLKQTIDRNLIIFILLLVHFCLAAYLVLQ